MLRSVGRCETNLRCVTSQKTTEFMETAAEAYDLDLSAAGDALMMGRI